VAGQIIVKAKLLELIKTHSSSAKNHGDEIKIAIFVEIISK